PIGPQTEPAEARGTDSEAAILKPPPEPEAGRGTTTAAPSDPIAPAAEDGGAPEGPEAAPEAEPPNKRSKRRPRRRGRRSSKRSPPKAPSLELPGTDRWKDKR
ncbi:MAG: hypothetical protein KC416_01760, partial [Myxococcales bacterium]|nr:hypothetical protein [Myxococcales bacterium]